MEFANDPCCDYTNYYADCTLKTRYVQVPSVCLLSLFLSDFEVVDPTAVPAGVSTCASPQCASITTDKLLREYNNIREPNSCPENIINVCRECE